jgi:hypothetical protein
MAKRAKRASSQSGDRPSRKKRTREHVIAELSVNFVERLALKCGYVVQRSSPDYGIDLRLETFDEQGLLEWEHVSLQVKATDNIRRYELSNQEWFSYPVSTRDYRIWSVTPLPVFFILYDGQMEEAYWLEIQKYERTQHPTLQGDTIHLHLPRNHVLGIETIRLMRRRKQQAVQLIQERLPR